MKFGLTQETIDKITNVFRKYPDIEEVIIYGSRAKGNYREGSDIDITLKGSGITAEIFTKVRRDIDELNTPYLFDISVFHALDSKSLKGHISRVGQKFYSR